MLILGIVLAVIAVVLIAFGVAGAAATWLLYLGIGLVIVAVVLVFLDRRGKTRL